MLVSSLICTLATCPWEIDTWGEMASQLPDCPTEDSADCLFDATQRGDGTGHSFFAIDNGDTVSLFYQPINGEMKILTYTK